MNPLASDTPPAMTLGNPWKMRYGEVEMAAEENVKSFIASEVAFAHEYYKNISQLLNVSDPTGGVIVDNQGWSLIMGKFQTEVGELVAAEGEIVEVITPDFDYCLSKLVQIS